MKAYALLKIKAGEIGAALTEIRAVKGVTHADMTFGPYDAVVTLETADLNALGHLVAWDLQTIPGVMETLTCLAVEI